MVEHVEKHKVWVLSDGRPGHYNQSRGVVKALEHLKQFEVTWLEVNLRAGFLRQVLKLLLNKTSFTLSIQILRLFYTFTPLPEDKPDIIVSSGGKTSFINAAMTRKFACTNIFCGSLRGLSEKLFSVVLTIDPAQKTERHVVLNVAPTILTPADAAVAGREFCAQKGLMDNKLWAMIIGGDGAGYKYHDDDWFQLADLMVGVAEKFSIRWILTTSPRTGNNAEELLRKQLPTEILADSVWYAAEPRKIMQAYLGASEMVFCTEDSMSMISEAIASGCPTITLSPQNSHPDSRYNAALNRYRDNSLICRLPMDSFINCPLRDLASNLKPLKTSSATLLAAKLSPYLSLKAAK